jgi:hypothetical protein
VGVRETRRIMGDYVLTKEDVVSGRKFPDSAIAKGAQHVDIHQSGTTQIRIPIANGGSYDTANAWYGLFAPAKTPEATVALLQNEVVAILQQPAVRKRMTELGAAPIGSKPAEFRKFQLSEMKRWKEVVDSARIRME